MSLKPLAALLLVLLASPALAQYEILGVLQTGDVTIIMDTVTFDWSTYPSQQFAPEGFGGTPGTEDSCVFEVTFPTFPGSVWMDYRRNGTQMPRDTIRNVQPDVWYTLPTGLDAETRVKFLRRPGIEEKHTPPGRSHLAPTHIRTTLYVPPSLFPSISCPLLDISGRRLMTLHPGANHVSHLAPGIYFVRTAVGGERSADCKVVITR
jgi:hypothetical protein